MAPELDELLTDVRASAYYNDWCISCGCVKCSCVARGYSNTTLISVRAILERIDDDARTIEQLTRSVHMVKDAEIATLRQQRDRLAEELFAKFFGARDPEFAVWVDFERRMAGLGDSARARINELLEANTREVERRRTAEAEHHEHALSVQQRAVRLLEEAIEAYQSAGADVAMAHRLVDYVFGRMPGALSQELGGIGVTLLALAEAAGLDAEVEEVREVRRVMSKPLEHFRERNAAKNEAGFEVTYER